MNLIIDTSSENLKTILYSKENETVFSNKNTGSKHLKTLLPEIEVLLNLAKTDLEKLKTISVVLGPGSFTGVRIGVSTVSAFAQVCKKTKLIGINMLDFLNFIISKKSKKDHCILIKSTSTKFYVGYYLNNYEKVFNKLMSYQELNKFIEENKKIEVYAFDNSLELGEVEIKNITLETQDYINYSNFLIENKKFIKLNELKPIYLAYSQAEEELMKKERANVNN